LIDLHFQKCYYYCISEGKDNSGFEVVDETQNKKKKKKKPKDNNEL